MSREDVPRIVGMDRQAVRDGVHRFNWKLTTKKATALDAIKLILHNKLVMTATKVIDMASTER